MARTITQSRRNSSSICKLHHTNWQDTRPEKLQRTNHATKAYVLMHVACSPDGGTILKRTNRLWRSRTLKRNDCSLNHEPQKCTKNAVPFFAVSSHCTTKVNQTICWLLLSWQTDRQTDTHMQNTQKKVTLSKVRYTFLYSYSSPK